MISHTYNTYTVMTYLNICGCVMSNRHRNEMGEIYGSHGVPIRKVGLARYDSSALKTVLQKCIRRCMTGDAVAVAKTMIQKGESSTLRRRLPVVVGEDVGWRHLWIAKHCSEEQTEIDLLRLVESACHGVRDKSCEPLIGRARRTPKEDAGKLMEYLLTGDVDGAARVVVHDMDPREKATGGSPIWSVLAQAAVELRPDLPDLPKVVVAVRKRLGQGLYQNDRSLLTIPLVQAICGKTYTKDVGPKEGWIGADTWRQLDPKPSSLQDFSAHTWAIDAHHWLGKIVGGILVRKKKIESVEWLSWAQFCCESGVVSPAKDLEYIHDWDLQIQAKWPSQTLGTMTAKYNEVREEIRSCMLWLLKERGLL